MNTFKKFVAICAAASMLLTLAACGGKDAEEETTAVNPTEAITDEVTEDVSGETAEDVSEEASTEEAATEEATEEETTEEATEAETEAEKAKAPTEKADILAIYNDASAKLISSKPGYSKSVTTTINTLEMGALSKISVVRGAIGDFLGEGTVTTTVSKGQSSADAHVKSSLTADDITAATCTLSDDGKYYDIKLTVKNETNPLKVSSALGRFTNDYKDQMEIIAGLSEAGASTEGLTMTTTSVVITAKISTDGEFTSLKQVISQNANFSGVKYTIVKVATATGSLTTTVDYSGFKY